jgi:hypothetical protein
MPLVQSVSMTHRQIELLEHALRLAAKLSETGWDGIPAELRPSFARYMSKDIWTGRCDLLDLRYAALMIVRDAIVRAGEFAGEEF